jgi:hypothetical protein
MFRMRNKDIKSVTCEISQKDLEGKLWYSEFIDTNNQHKIGQNSSINYEKYNNIVVSLDDKMPGHT